ncbi:MAG TPA: DUF6104 family protein [Streptosporangiaceae bacterium]|nr:DUF6104 family protein [Streptosporangiaceae bacterium]
MYFTDRGSEELGERRGEEQVTLGWLATWLAPPTTRTTNRETRVPRSAAGRCCLPHGPQEIRRAGDHPARPCAGWQDRARRSAPRAGNRNRALGSRPRPSGMRVFSSPRSAA